MGLWTFNSAGATHADLVPSAPINGKNVVEKGIEWTLSSDRRDELADGPSGKIPWIGKGLFATLQALPVETMKAFQRHVDLTTYCKHRRRVANKTQWDARNRSQIISNLLPINTVATGSTNIEYTISVNCLNRHAIEFQLGNVFDGIDLETFAHSLVELPYICLFGTRIKRLHGRLVLNLRKL